MDTQARCIACVHWLLPGYCHMSSLNVDSNCSCDSRPAVTNELNIHQGPLTSQTCHQGPMAAGVGID